MATVKRTFLWVGPFSMARAAGAAGFAPKQDGPDKLIATLRQVLAGEGERRGSAPVPGGRTAIRLRPAGRCYGGGPDGGPPAARLAFTALSKLAEKRRTVFWIVPTDV